MYLLCILSNECDHKCHIGPLQALYDSLHWLSGQYFTSKQGLVYNGQFNILKTLTLRNVCAVVQESSEEKTRQTKERLSRLFEANERRCSRSVLYGSELLQACTLSSEPAHSALTAGGWRWVGRESCLRAQRTCVATTSALQSALLSVEDRLLTANSLIKR